jgi:IS4 transposase
MFRISRIQQLMQGLPRGRFERSVERFEGDKHVKRFGCWDLLVAQVFGQLGDSRSLREVESGYNAHAAHHYHLGTGPLRRATLADALQQRNPAVFEDAARELMGQASRRLRRQSQQALRLLDSTSVTLAGRGFDDWTRASRTARTQGVKLHLVFDPEAAEPVSQAVTAANVNDVTHAWTLPLTRGATYVFDKGYCDYAWWARFDAHEAWFVTRLKRNARVTVEGPHGRAGGDMAILADERIRLANPHPGGGRRRNPYSCVLRRITVARPGAEPLVLVSNDLQRSASQIAACYKARWQIELFFKWLKQNLRIQRFYGRSENAVRIQIYCALIAYLLVSAYRATTGAAASMLHVLATLRVGLFQRPAIEAVLASRRRRSALAHDAVQAGLFG